MKIIQIDNEPMLEETSDEVLLEETSGTEAMLEETTDSEVLLEEGSSESVLLEEKPETEEDRRKDPLQPHTSFDYKKGNNSVLNAIIGILIVLIIGVYFFLSSNKDEVSLSSYYSNVELNNEIDSLSYTIGIGQTSGLKEYLCDKLTVDTTLMDDFCKGLIESTIKRQESNIDYYDGLARGLKIFAALDSIDSTVLQKNGKRIDRDIFFYGLLNGIRNDNSRMSKDDAEQFVKRYNF